MAEIRDPNQDANFNKSNVFNKHFIKYLSQSGWQNEEIRKEFLSLVNSIVLSTKSNTTMQKRMVSFLDTALETLSIELKTLELNKNDEIVNVDTDELVEQATNKIMEGCGCKKQTVHDNKFGNDIKQLMFGFKKELQEMGIEKKIQDNLIRITFDISSEIGQDKKILLDKLKIKSEAAVDFIKANNKMQITEEESEDNNIKGKSDEGKTAKKTDKPKKEKSSKENKSDGEDEQLSEKEKDIKVNNFKVFFENYLVDDIGYNIDDAERIINFIINHVNKFTKDKSGQTKLNRDLNELVNRIKNSYPNSVGTNDNTKNFDIAMDNLSKVSVLFNGWGKNATQQLKENLLQLASLSDSVQIQKSIVGSISKISKKFKNYSNEK